MIIIITGATHVGKTLLAQKLLEEYKIPYVSQDHLKMGLIRSGYSTLSPASPDEEMTAYLWPVTREMIKTAIENKQNLIVEGCYIPFDWRNDFTDSYLQSIRFICLCLSEKYINEHYNEIIKHQCCIENRIDDGYCTKELLIKENNRFYQGCINNNLNCTLIDENYESAINSINYK